VVGCWTRDQKVAGSTSGRGAIKSTRSRQPSITSRVGKSSVTACMAVVFGACSLVSGGR